MDAREYLERAILLDRQIENRLMILRNLRATAAKTTAWLSETPGCGARNPHGLEQIVAKIVDMEREIDADIDRLVDIKADIVDTLSRVPDPMCRLYLERRYLGGQTGADIARSMNYSITWAKDHHRLGLQMVQELLDNR